MVAMENIEQINTYLSFMIDNEYFAVNVCKVLEVLQKQKQKIMRVPNVSEDIKGVINFRGEIISVFETRTKFGLPDRAADENYVVIVLEIMNNNVRSTIGAIVDGVKDVITIEHNEIMSVPKMQNKFKAEVISGIFKKEEDFIMLLDIDKLFSVQELEMINEMTTNA